MNRRVPPSPGEVYLEFTQISEVVRVAAVDAATGREVVVMGPASTPRAELERLAVQKLRWVEAAHPDPQPEPQPRPATGRGVIV